MHRSEVSRSPTWFITPLQQPRTIISNIRSDRFELDSDQSRETTASVYRFRVLAPPARPFACM